MCALLLALAITGWLTAATATAALRLVLAKVTHRQGQQWEAEHPEDLPWTASPPPDGD